MRGRTKKMEVHMEARVYGDGEAVLEDKREIH